MIGELERRGGAPLFGRTSGGVALTPAGRRPPDGLRPASDRPEFDRPEFDRPEFDRPEFDRPESTGRNGLVTAGAHAIGFHAGPTWRSRPSAAGLGAGAARLPGRRPHPSVRRGPGSVRPADVTGAPYDRGSAVRGPVVRDGPQRA